MIDGITPTLVLMCLGWSALLWIPTILVVLMLRDLKRNPRKTQWWQLWRR